MKQLPKNITPMLRHAIYRARKEERDLAKSLVFMATPFGAVSGGYGRSIALKLKGEYLTAKQNRMSLERTARRMGREK